MDEEQSCCNHPERKALSFCHHCGRYYCFECLKEGSEFYYCKNPQCLLAMKTELHPPEPQEEYAEAPETLPENLDVIGIYPGASDAEVVKARLESEGLECFLREEPCGLIEEPYIVPYRLMVKETDAEKAFQILKSPESAGRLPEPVSSIFNFVETRDAEAAKDKLASLGMESFIWDSFSTNENVVHESFCLLVRTSNVEKAAGVVLAPETEEEAE